MAQPATILCIVGSYSVFGSLENRGLRVLDVLNDPGTEFLHIGSAVVRNGIDGNCLQELSEATIPKSAIDFVLVEQDGHESSLRRKHAFVAKKGYSAFVLVGDYEIRGTLPLKGTPDAVSALARELSGYFPITRPRLSRPGTTELSTGVAIINRRKVALLQVQGHVVE